MRPIVPAALALLAAAGCADRPSPPRYDVAGHFATTLDAAAGAADATLGRVEAYEEETARDARAVAFGLGQPARPNPARPVARAVRGPAAAMPEPGTVAAADRFLEPAFAALDRYAGHLSALAADTMPVPGQPDAAALARAAGEGLAALEGATRRPAAEPVRAQGLAAIATLAAPPAAGAAPSAVAAERQPALVALAALLGQVVGGDANSGLRGSLGARQGTARANQGALLEAVRRDRSLSVLDRHRAYLLGSDDGEGRLADAELADLAQVFPRMVAAHATLARPDAAGAPAEMAAFAAAVERLAQANLPQD